MSAFVFGAFVFALCSLCLYAIARALGKILRKIRGKRRRQEIRERMEDILFRDRWEKAEWESSLLFKRAPAAS